MKAQVILLMNLSEFLQAEIDSSSIRKVAKKIGIGPTTVTSIAKGKRVRAPDVDTLQKIADAYGLTLAAVVEMTGAMMGDKARYEKLAREMETHPWIAEEWARLTRLSHDRFKEAMDYIAWRERHPSGPPLPPNGDQPNP
jgi:transcriptional regulator with XRE-family HTH domain